MGYSNDFQEFVLGTIVLAALWWAYTRPRTHWMHLLWRAIVLSKIDKPINERRLASFNRVSFWLMFVGCASMTLVRLLFAIGIVHRPPPSWEGQKFDSNKWEIVTTGQTIYARPRASSGPSTQQ